RTSHLTKYAAGVVHENVHASGCRGSLGDECVDGALVPDVDHARRAATAAGGAEPTRLLQLGLDNVARPHVRTVLRERETDRAAQSMRRAGDDSGLAAEVEIHACWA